MRFFSTLFWGIFLLSSGVILLLKHIFNLHWVSSGKLIFGLFIVLLGISLLSGNYGWNAFDIRGDNVTAFSGGQQVAVKEGGEYTVLFGDMQYDLSDLEPGSHVKISCVFGSCTIKLPQTGVDVTADCAFGNVRLPNGEIFFGNLPYSKGDDPRTQVEVKCAFGSVSTLQ